MALNLEKQLLFYGAYHHNPVNVAIHITCVPAILITSFLLATNSPSIPLPSWATLPYFPANLGTLSTVVYSTLYILMEPVAGGLLAPILLASTAYSNHLTDTYGWEINKWAIFINVASWIAQFIGHGKFEGRAPALLDNLVQAVFLAPFFVWFEILFACGYRADLKARLDEGVEKEIQKFRDEKKVKGAKGLNGKANGVANGKAK